MTEEQKKAIDACKDQAACEHLNKDGFPFLTYKEARQQVTGFINDEIVDRAMQLYGEQCRKEERGNALLVIQTAYECMEYLGDVLNGMDAVTDEDEEYVNPRFDSTRKALVDYGVPDGSDDLPY